MGWKAWLAIGAIVVLVGSTGYLAFAYTGTSSDLTEANLTIADYVVEFAGLEQDVSSLTDDLDTMIGERDTLLTEKATLEGEKADLEGDLSNANSQISSLQSNLSSKTTELNSEKARANALQSELNMVMYPRHFGSAQELADWLQQDDTNIEYVDIKDSNYLQMSFILEVRAAMDGYILPAYVVPLDADTCWISNIACIGDTFYLVEAGDDSVTEYYTYWNTVPSCPIPQGQ